MKRPATMSRPMKVWRRTDPKRRARKLLHRRISGGECLCRRLDFLIPVFPEAAPAAFSFSCCKSFVHLKGQPLRELSASDGKIPESMSAPPDTLVLSAAAALPKGSYAEDP